MVKYARCAKDNVGLLEGLVADGPEKPPAEVGADGKSPEGLG